MKIWAENPPNFPMVTFGLGGLGGRLLPMDFGNFGPKGTVGKSPNFWWPGGGLPIKFGNLGPRPPRPKETIGKMGVLNQDFSPELSPPQGRLRVFKPALSLLPNSLGRALGKIWVANPPLFGWPPPLNGFWEFWS